MVLRILFLIQFALEKEKNDKKTEVVSKEIMRK